MTFVDLEWIVFYKGKVPDSTRTKCAGVGFTGKPREKGSIAVLGAQLPLISALRITLCDLGGQEKGKEKGPWVVEVLRDKISETLAPP